MMANTQRTPPNNFKLCSSNPDLSTASTSTDTDIFINMRKRKQPESDELNSMMEALELKIANQMETFKVSIEAVVTESVKNAVNLVLEREMCKLTTSINDTLNQFNIRLDDMQESINYVNNRQDMFDARLKAIEDDSLRRKELPTQLSMLESKIDMMEQQVRQFNIEIVNLPERRDENLIAILQKIGSSIKHPINPTDIVSVHRVPHMDKNNPHPKNVIAKFSTKIIRDNVVAAARVVKCVKSDQLLISGTSRNIYINEHLTPKNKKLFLHSREVARKNNYKFVWIKHGTILVRQNDTSPIFSIRSEQDINKIKP